MNIIWHEGRKRIWSSEHPCDKCGLVKDSCRDTWGNDDTSTNVCADCEPWGQGSNDSFYHKYFLTLEPLSPKEIKQWRLKNGLERMI